MSFRDGPGSRVESPPAPGAETDAGLETPAAQTEPETAPAAHTPAGNMLPGRERRRLGIERLTVRLVATFGIIAVGVALGAILTSSNVQGWIIGLVVSGVSVILAAVLWSSRQL